MPENRLALKSKICRKRHKMLESKLKLRNKIKTMKTITILAATFAAGILLTTGCSSLLQIRFMHQIHQRVQRLLLQRPGDLRQMLHRQRRLREVLPQIIITN